MRTSLGIMLMLTGLLLTACGKHESEHTVSAKLETVEVHVSGVLQKGHTRTQGLPGTVHPADQAELASKLMATVAEANVVIGQKVRQSEILLVLEADEIQAQVQQAEAMLAQLQRNLERERTLLAQRATTAEAVRTLQDQIRLAQAQLAEANTMESYTLLRAPFDGTITSKDVRRGDLATPGRPLLTMEGEGLYQVYVQVPDSLVALDYGQKVNIIGNGQNLDGKLTEWSPAADPSSRTRLAKLDLEDSTKARSGQYVKVLWPAEETSSLWMPIEALSRMGQMERAFVYEEGHLNLQLVKTGSVMGDLVQILAGLHEGDQVVLSPDSRIKDGQPAILLP